MRATCTGHFSGKVISRGALPYQLFQVNRIFIVYNNNTKNILIVNKKTINKFISNSFEIDCIDIRLTQKKDKDPIVYRGPGTIYQDEHGILQLKLYSKLGDTNKEISHHFKHCRPGKIIASDEFFSLKATDMSGNEWLADDIYISITISSPLTGVIIKSRLDEIKTIELNKARANTKKDYLSVVYIKIKMLNLLFLRILFITHHITHHAISYIQHPSTPCLCSYLFFSIILHFIILNYIHFSS